MHKCLKLYILLLIYNSHTNSFYNCRYSVVSYSFRSRRFNYIWQAKARFLQDKMRITRQHLFWTIALSCLVESRSRFSFPPNNHSDKDFFVDILSEVLRTSRARDALLVLRGSLLDGQTDDILDKIFAATNRRVPILYINATDQTDPSQVSSCGMSRDLVVYIYVSEREPDTVEGELIAEDMKRFIHDRVRPEVLVLMIRLRRPCRNLATFFRTMWSRNILDAIVVEYSRVSEHSEKYSTIVHRYDPFADSHYEEPYSINTTWFTDDFPNMRGYPFVYAFIRRPPYSDIVESPKEHELKGIDKIMIDILADKMNFTKVPEIILRRNLIFFRRMSNGTLYGILSDVASKKYDALLISLPMWGNVYYLGPAPAIQYTYPLFMENWCFVVPKVFAQQNFMSSIALQMVVLNFSIIGIFWLCSQLMKFNPRWHVAKIIGIMLAASFPPELRKFHERVVLLSIIAVYACYSSTLFAELTSTSFKNNRYIQYDRLQDLVNSDLVLMTDANVLAIISQYSSEFKTYKADKKIIGLEAALESCLKNMLMHQNVTCFMETNWAQLFAVNNMRNDETMLEVTKLCYLSPPSGNVFSEGSPYIRRFSELFLMLKEGGIRDKWYREYMWNETKETTIQTNQNQTNVMYVNIFHPLICILITGYSISTLVFIGELIWKYLDISLHLCNAYHLLNLKKNSKKNKHENRRRYN